MSLFAATRALGAPALRQSVRLMATKPASPPPSSSTAKPSSTSAPKAGPDSTAADSRSTVSPNTSNLPSLDFDPASQRSSPSGRTGARSAGTDFQTNADKQRKTSLRVFLALCGMGMVAGWVHMGREWAPEEATLKKDSEIAGYTDTRVSRANARIADLLDFFSKPIEKKILPPEQHRPYTLVLSLDDLLVTSTWDREHGWRTAKRPGFDYFIRYLSQFYEVVILTSQAGYTADPIFEQLDPYGAWIPYKLNRDYTRSVRGKIVKDLSYLNRDLSKVILIDTHEDHISTHPENSILMPKWKGDPKDKGLVGLIPFLESIAILNTPDVRPVVTAYHGKDIASTYAQMEAMNKQRHVEQWQKKQQSRHVPSSGSLRIGGFFGGASHQNSDPSKPPLTYLEQKRQEAMQMYLAEQKWYYENEEELFKKPYEEWKKAQMDAMASGGSILGLLTGPKPPEGEGNAIPSKESTPPPSVSSSSPSK